MIVDKKQEFLKRFSTIFIILFGITYIPLEPRGFGVIKLSLMVFSIVIFFYASKGKSSKALVLGLVCLALQLLSAYWHSSTFRASTFFFGCGFVVMYISFYNLICQEKVFSIHYFIKLIVFMIYVYFAVCLIQQACIIVGLRYFPLVNLCHILNRGIGCNSLCMEPSHLSRHLLVFYYAYIKCNEYLRGEGPLTIKELFSEEHRIVTLPFLWMMCTIGSGTAFVCLALLSLYFIRKDYAIITIPVLLSVFFIIVPFIPYEPLQRAASMGMAISTMNQETVKETDGSAASRITPLLNSFEVDLSDPETWFGKGIDSGRHEGKSIYDATLFDDYGLLYYFAKLALCISCAYQFRSLAFLFMILGVGGGAGGNIYYTWYLMIIMTCVKHFHDTKNEYWSSYDEETDDDIVLLEV